MVENGFDASAKADKIYKDVNNLMDSKSSIEKFDLHNQLVAEWQSLGCDERREVGKALEIKSPGGQHAGTTLKANFDYKDGEIKALTFSKMVERDNQFTTSMVVYKDVKETIQNPLDICKKSGDK